MARVCNCTNQCPGCGSCCQVDCGCRLRTARWWPSTPITPETTPTAPTKRPVEIGFTARKPLTEEGLERILREAFAEALKELRELLSDAPPKERHDG